MNSKRIDVVVIGVGAMGRHHVRVLGSLTSLFNILGVYDIDHGSRSQVASNFGLRAFDTLQQAIDAAELVVVATPTSSHFDISKAVLLGGRHVFVEKPVCATFTQARELLSISTNSGLKLAVGHTERFNPVVEWLNRRIAEEEVFSINVLRVGPKPPRIRDVGIVTDLAVHDLDLVTLLGRAELENVFCVGRATNGTQQDIAQIATQSANGVVGSITTNWLTPFKARQISIASRSGVFQADLLRNLCTFFTGVKDTDARFIVEETRVPWIEPLLSQARALYGYVRNDEPSVLISMKQAVEVVRWVEHCEKQLAANVTRSSR